MKQVILIAIAAICTYLGYKTLDIYLSLNNGHIGFRFTEPMDWMLYTLLIVCFGFAWHALTGLFAKRKSA
jgi:preprotein translocase subunit SecY